MNPPTYRGGIRSRMGPRKPGGSGQQYDLAARRGRSRAGLTEGRPGVYGFGPSEAGGWVTGSPPDVGAGLTGPAPVGATPFCKGDSGSSEDSS